MNNLGELLEYTGEPCPNCGRVRVQKWSCGKHICEKCNYCIEDDKYYYEEWDDDDYWVRGIDVWSI